MVTFWAGALVGIGAVEEHADSMTAMRLSPKKNILLDLVDIGVSSIIWLSDNDEI